MRRPLRRVATLATAVATVVAMALVVLGLAWPWPWLLVREGDALRYVFPGGEGTRFALRWTHSVEKEDWIEEFRLTGGAIELIATRFKTFGAGVPASVGRRTTLDNGRVLMRGIARAVDPLAVQAAHARHYRLRYGERWYVLSAPGAQPILTFTNAREPLFRVLPALVGSWLGEGRPA